MSPKKSEEKLPLDDYDYKFMRKDALTTAAGLIQAYTPEVEDDGDLAETVTELAKALLDWITDPFGPPTATSGAESSDGGGSKQSGGTRSSSSRRSSGGGNRRKGGGGGKKRYEQTDTPCPWCEEDGRDGVIAELVPGNKGPAEQCSLRKTEKRNGEYVDVGECSYYSWGEDYED